MKLLSHRLLGMYGQILMLSVALGQTSDIVFSYGVDSRLSGGGCVHIGISTTIFILLFCGPAVLTLHGMLDKLFIYNFGNAQIYQSGDEIISFSRQPDQILF